MPEASMFVRPRMKSSPEITLTERLEPDVIVAGFEGQDGDKLRVFGEAATIGGSSASSFWSRLQSWGLGKAGRVSVLANPDVQDSSEGRLVVVGMGQEGKEPSAQNWIEAGAKGTRAAEEKGATRVELALESQQGASGYESYVFYPVLGAILGGWHDERHKTNEGHQQIDNISVLVPEGADKEKIKTAVNKARIMGEATNVAREIANTPPNEGHPALLAERIRQLVEPYGIQVEILDEAQMREKGMNGVLTVNSGSANEARFVKLRYRAPNKPGKRLAMVGKGVNFDTGGLDLKAAGTQFDMKFDKTGASGIAGAMVAIAQLQPNIDVDAYLPLVENKTGSNAYVSSDVITLSNGRTLEINNTDAEGRVILADGIIQARKEGKAAGYQEDFVVEASSLTGAAMQAVGDLNGLFNRTVLMGNDLTFRNMAETAANAMGESTAVMEGGEEYASQITSSAIADSTQVGPKGKGGGAQIAYEFLKFHGDNAFYNEGLKPEDRLWKFVHADIAPSAWVIPSDGRVDFGASGVIARTYAQLALDLAEKGAAA